MHYTNTLLILCAIINIYQSRYTILQLTGTGLKTAICFLTDFHHYVQQWENSFKVIRTGDTSDTYYNYDLAGYERECPEHHYNIQMISQQPLVIYIEHFLTSNEMDHLIKLANPLFEHSKVASNGGSTTNIEANFRKSSTAYLPRSATTIVKCVENRLAQFQGNINPLNIEPLQVVKYQSDQFFNPHFDWFANDSAYLNFGGQRVTTFFTYLYANCTESETEFLEIKYNQTLHSRFCDILICDDMAEQHGLRFRPIPGNSIFWFNVDGNGHGDKLTLHAGRPPNGDGLKIGLNTWTRRTIFDYKID